MHLHIVGVISLIHDDVCFDLMRRKVYFSDFCESHIMIEGDRRNFTLVLRSIDYQLIRLIRQLVTQRPNLVVLTRKPSPGSVPILTILC